MSYQVNMMANVPDGFTDAHLEESLRRHAAAVDPPLEVRRSDTECLELLGQPGLLATLAPAGPDPFDYLLVDFEERGSWDQAPQILVVAAMAEELQLTVLELESRLEYAPRQWAAVRARYHSPDPSRRGEARRLELDREIEFFERRGLPYSTEERAILYRAVDAVDDSDLQQQAQALRDRKKKEDRPAVPVRGRRYTDPSEKPGFFKWFKR